ncbi:MAG: sigma factor-like helix-turn-helix DNA-binding protein [Myxococcota bacterium]
MFTEDNLGLPPSVPSSAQLACDVRRLLASLEPRDRELVQLAALGYTRLEMANLLGTTRKAVERRLERLRNALRSSG